MESSVGDAISARQDGRYDEAVRLQTELFDQIDSGALPLSLNHFITMFEWSLLVDEYLPAHQALADIRDEQVRRLRDGQEKFGPPAEEWAPSRFKVVIEMNDILNDQQSTYELFGQLISLSPSLARREARLALPAVVAAGDFVLANAYLPDPMARLAELNRLAGELPLYPPLRAAPRLAAELSNFMGDVVLCAAVLDGLGRHQEAVALRDDALTGLATDEMRALGIAEIATPGSIVRKLTSHQMELEGAALPDE